MQRRAILQGPSHPPPVPSLVHCRHSSLQAKVDDKEKVGHLLSSKKQQRPRPCSECNHCLLCMIRAPCKRCEQLEMSQSSL